MTRSQYLRSMSPQTPIPHAHMLLRSHQICTLRHGVTYKNELLPVFWKMFRPPLNVSNCCHKTYGTTSQSFYKSVRLTSNFRYVTPWWKIFCCCKMTPCALKKHIYCQYNDTLINSDLFECIKAQKLTIANDIVTPWQHRDVTPGHIL